MPRNATHDTPPEAVDPRPQTGLARRASKLASRQRAAEAAQAAALAERPMLSPEGAGRYLGVSRWSVYRMIDRGELRAYRVGEQLRIKPDDVDSYLASRVS